VQDLPLYPIYWLERAFPHSKDYHQRYIFDTFVLLYQFRRDRIEQQNIPALVTGNGYDRNNRRPYSSVLKLPQLEHLVNNRPVVGAAEFTALGGIPDFV
jgi:hypothetical protein